MARCTVCGANAGFLMSICVDCAARANPHQPPTVGHGQAPYQAPPLARGMEVRVEAKGGGGGVATGRLLDINAAGIRLDAGDAQLDITWKEISAILQRVPRQRAPVFTIVFAILGAAVFGSCGWLLDGLNNMGKLVPSHEPTPLTTYGLLLGGLIAGLLGLLIDRLLPKTRWQKAPVPQLASAEKGR
jgi:hypothetical protein